MSERAMTRFVGVDTTGSMVIVDPPEAPIGGASHPNLAAHEALGISIDSHTHAVYATDLTDHAATTHGTQAHVISGGLHTSTLSISQIPTGQTGTTVPLGNDARFTDARTPLVHTHIDADLPAGLARDAEVAAAYSVLGHSHPGGSEAFPVGAVFLAVVSTNPATLLGYGTWSAFGAGRVLVGLDSGDTDFDTAEETGGAKTKAISAHAGATVGNHVFTQPADHTDVINHTHPVTDPGHTHLTQRYPTATGGSSGFTIDTSMSGTLADNTLPTKSGTTGVTTSNPAGGVAALAHSGGAVDAHAVGQASAHSDVNVVQPYIVVYMWKRTA